MTDLEYLKKYGNKDTLDDDIKSTPKNINKQTKKAVETTQTATDYESLKNAWNNIQADGDNTTQYTINLKKWKI